MSSVEPLAFSALRGLRSCCRRDCERGLGVLRGEVEGPERKRGRREEEGWVLGLRLNEILGRVSKEHVHDCVRRTARKDRRLVGRRPGVLLHRCGRLRQLAAFRSMTVRMGLC